MARQTPLSDIRIFLFRPAVATKGLDPIQVDIWERNLNRRVLDADVLMTEMGAFQATLRFDNSDLRLFEYQAIMPEQQWWIKIAPSETVRNGRSLAEGAKLFRIRKVKGYKTLTIRLLSAESDLDVKKDIKLPHSGTISQVVSNLGEKLDLVPSHLLEIQNQGATLSLGPAANRLILEDQAVNKERADRLKNNFITPTFATYASLPQQNKSNAQFLTQLAKKVGFVWYIEEDASNLLKDSVIVGKPDQRLRFIPRTFDRNAAPLLGELDGTAEAGYWSERLVREPEFSIDSGTNVFFGHGADSENFWSPVTKQFNEIQNDIENLEEVASGQMTPINPDRVIDFTSTTETVAQRQEEADKLLAAFETALITVEIEVVGDWSIRPRMLMHLRGFGWVVSGMMWIDSVRHRVSRGRVFTTQITLRANAMDIEARDFIANADRLHELRKRWREFDTQVLQRHNGIAVGKGYGDTDSGYIEDYKWTAREAEQMAQAGYINQYRHFFNVAGKK